MTLLANRTFTSATAAVLVAGLSSCMFDKPADVPDPDAVPSEHRVGGLVAGMWDGANLTLELAADGLAEPVVTTVAANGTFEFDADVRNGSAFTVSIASAPAGHTCTIEGAAGTIDDANVDDVAITCDGPEVDVAFSAPIPLALDPATTAYDVDVSVVIQQTRIAVTAPAATNIRINEVFGYDSGDWTAAMPLSFGANAFEIEVEVDTASRVFNVTVDRGAAEVAQYLFAKASNSEPSDRLGDGSGAIAIDGDTMVVGASGEASATGLPGDNGALSSGAAYVFRRVGSQWQQEGYLKASAIDPGDEFGSSVAISGDFIAVGAPREDSVATGINGDDDDDSGGDIGAVYVYRREGSTWAFDAYIKPGINPGTAANFGRAVTLDGNTLAAGMGHPIFGGVLGVYVYTRTVAWSQQAYIPPPVAADNDTFGSALDLDGDSLAIGARSEASCATTINGSQTDNACDEAGAAYVYVRSGSTWTRQVYLKAANTDAEDLFGSSVAIEGDTVVVGAPREDSGSALNPADDSATDRGAIYVFQRSGTTWSQTVYLKSSDVSPFFGTDVDISGELIAASSSSGNIVTLFRRASTWSQAAIVQPDNLQSSDDFGRCIALSRDGLTAGAPGEDSVADGINPVDDGLAPTTNQTGAAYAFR